MNEDIYILLVDDHEMILEAMSMLLASMSEVGRVYTASDSAGALELLDRERIDFVILDIAIGKEDGRDLFKLIKQRRADLPCVALSSNGESSVVKTAMYLGFDGYLLKTDGREEISLALETIRGGGKFISTRTQQEIVNDHIYKKEPVLTERELEVLQMISEELSTKEIASLLFVSVKTIENHRMHLMQKLGVNNVAGLIRKGITNGYIKI